MGVRFNLKEYHILFFCIVEKVGETAAVHLAIADPTDTDIPHTGAELPFLYGFSFLLLCGAAIVVFTHRKEKY